MRMNRKKLLDRLKRLESVTPLEHLIMVFANYNESKGKYICDCRIWNGVNYSGTKSIQSEHNTAQDAIDQIDIVAERYPPKNKVPVFVDDNLDGRYVSLTDEELEELADENISELRINEFMDKIGYHKIETNGKGEWI